MFMWRPLELGGTSVSAKLVGAISKLYSVSDAAEARLMEKP